MIWRWTIAYALVSISLASPLSAQFTALEEGVRLMREEQFDRALVNLKQAHSVAPRNATIENLLGITETQLGHIDEACNHYRNAIRLDLTRAAPHRNLGFNLLNSRDYSHAEPELREASRLDPNDKFAHDYLMLLLLATGRDAEALAEATRAGELVDRDPDASAALIEAEVRTGHVADATSRLQDLEQANKISSAREYSIAVLLSQHAFNRQAANCFRRIATLDPSWENRYNLALGLLYSGQAADAATLLTALHTERPTNADALMFLGSSFELQQKVPEALEAYRAALLADPSNPDRTLDYTRVLMDLDRYDDAIQVVQTGMEQTSATAPLQLRLGAVEMVKGDYVAARDAFNAALATDPRLDAAYVGIAQTYARQANDVEAIKVLEEARTKFPGRYLLEYYFGLLASRLGREQEAIPALEKAAELEPKSPDPLYELGKLYESQENWLQARRVLENAIALNPQLAPAHYRLGQVYAHMGQNAKAEQEAQQTHTLVDTQRDEALHKQRERAASFQPQPPAAALSLP
jgi:tetratricopeptide (TPR) repeat protein